MFCCAYLKLEMLGFCRGFDSQQHDVEQALRLMQDPKADVSQFDHTQSDS